MNKISTPIATYERSFGTLTAVTSPTVADSLAGQRQAALYEAYQSGIPGYVARGTMTPRQVLDYMATRLITASRHSGAPINDRPVDVMLTTDGVNEGLVGTVEFGKTMTQNGLLASRDGKSIAHVTTFAVSRNSPDIEALSTDQLSDVALVLGYAALLAASDEFDTISYCVEETVRPQALEQLDALGLADDIQTYGEIPRFASPVSDPIAMIRTEYALDIKAARDAMEATHPWLAAGASQ